VKQFREKMQQQHQDGAPSRKRKGKRVDPQEEKDAEMEFQDAKRALMAVYGHSDTESSDNERRKAIPRHVRRFLGHHIQTCHQDSASRDCGGGPSTESSTTPQVGGNSDWVQYLRLPQEHARRRAAPVAGLPDHLQR
jgi:hypothetical protein